MVSLIDSANKVVYHTQPKYHYLYRDNSLSAAHYLPEMRDCVESQIFVQQYIYKKYPNLIEATQRHCPGAFIYVFDAMLLHSGYVEQADKKKYAEYLRSNWKSVLKCPHFPMLRRLSVIALCIHESLYKILLIIVSHLSRIQKKLPLLHKKPLTHTLGKPL